MFHREAERCIYYSHFFNVIAYFFVLLYFFFGELSVDVFYLFLFWSGRFLQKL